LFVGLGFCGCGVGILWYAVATAVRGVARPHGWRWPRVCSRRDTPVRFWLHVIQAAASGVVAVAIGLFVLTRPG
jgi:hypothetical protein